MCISLSLSTLSKDIHRSPVPLCWDHDVARRKIRIRQGFENTHQKHSTLDGVITPAILTSLAQSNTIVYLPTPDGIRTSLTRVRNAIWIGAYTVDPASWNVEDRTYRLATRTGRTQIAPGRTVAQLHRLKRRQFERR